MVVAFRVRADRDSVSKMLGNNKRPKKGPSLAFQKEPQDNPIPVFAEHLEIQIPEGQHPEISRSNPGLGH